MHAVVAGCLYIMQQFLDPEERYLRSCQIQEPVGVLYLAISRHFRTPHSVFDRRLDKVAPMCLVYSLRRIVSVRVSVCARARARVCVCV